MISFLYKMANNFESEHGFRPNLLYLNPLHYSQLRKDLANIHGLDELVQFLGMEIVLDRDSGQPHVAYSEIDWSHRRAV